jgi:di/tricarboxylate transporter
MSTRGRLDGMQVDAGDVELACADAPQTPRPSSRAQAVLDLLSGMVLQVRRYPVSVFIAIAGWSALVFLASMPASSICVSAGDRCLDGKSYWTLALLLGALLMMVNDAAPDLIMLAFSVLLVLSNVISDAEAWAGCSSPSVLSIGALFVVARALEETRAVETIMLPLLGRPSGHWSALLRLCPPVMVFSGFLNNTPIVAMMIPMCEQWAAENDLSIKVMLMPLSFASMLGGMCTLIGTSTNLVLNSQIEADKDAPLAPLSMFSMTAVAAPSAVIGMVYLTIAAPIFFQERVAQAESAENDGNAAEDPEAVHSRRGQDDEASSTISGSKSESARSAVRSRPAVRGIPRYSIEVLVTDECTALIGKEPRHMTQLAPSCDARLLIRAGIARSPMPDILEPNLALEANDRLIVACLAEGVELLLKVPGLVVGPDGSKPGKHQTPAHLPGTSLVLVEASVAHNSPLVNVALRDARSVVFSGADVWAIRQRKKAPDRRANVRAWAQSRATPALFSSRAVSADAPPKLTKATSLDFEPSPTAAQKESTSTSTSRRRSSGNETGTLARGRSPRP